MGVMWIVLPVALAIAVVAVLVFAWSVRSGQFDDLVTPSLRILVDDETIGAGQAGVGPEPDPPRAPNQTGAEK